MYVGVRRSICRDGAECMVKCMWGWEDCLYGWGGMNVEVRSVCRGGDACM